MSKIFITSTMGQSVFYDVYKDGPKGANGLPEKIRVKTILIKGGTGVISHGTLITPNGGIVTQVSKEDLELLKKDRTFQRQVQNGYIAINEGKGADEKPKDDDLESKDNGAQLTPETYEEKALNDNPLVTPAKISAESDPQKIAREREQKEKLAAEKAARKNRR